MWRNNEIARTATIVVNAEAGLLDRSGVVLVGRLREVIERPGPIRGEPAVALPLSPVIFQKPNG